MKTTEATKQKTFNKREILQPILNGIESGWEITKPSPLDPNDRTYLCIFQKPSEYKEARVDIPTPWYEDAGGRRKIEATVRDAIRKAVVK